MRTSGKASKIPADAPTDRGTKQN
ncbi:hypothetical protein U9M48_026001 [Paspalum notatum var. saurae]|uniref:Uncharacterized protein n=1 Tax=Paspalum notatum var. saurae TaxID=547442 RepID=A0AAQ3TV54_PASNO